MSSPKLRVSKKLSEKLGKETIFATRVTIDAIIEIVQEFQEEAITASRSNDWYALPAWDKKQADYIGQQRAYQKLLDVLTIKGEDNG